MIYKTLLATSLVLAVHASPIPVSQSTLQPSPIPVSQPTLQPSPSPSGTTTTWVDPCAGKHKGDDCHDTWTKDGFCNSADTMSTMWCEQKTVCYGKQEGAHCSDDYTMDGKCQGNYCHPKPACEGKQAGDDCHDAWGSSGKCASMVGMTELWCEMSTQMSPSLGGGYGGYGGDGGYGYGGHGGDGNHSGHSDHGGDTGGYGVHFVYGNHSGHSDHGGDTGGHGGHGGGHGPLPPCAVTCMGLLPAVMPPTCSKANELLNACAAGCPKEMKEAWAGSSRPLSTGGPCTYVETVPTTQPDLSPSSPDLSPSSP